MSEESIAFTSENDVLEFAVPEEVFEALEGAVSAAAKPNDGLVELMNRRPPWE
ncbi:hypothetical protein [Rhodoluna limnophila]|uniref:hypothetical protein n=1 Tax=Rhodoluna limnophila TaxID=232537 RepID=UPI0015629E27|nr:hypothetical protein [Rhodoluna limnophila]